MNVALVASHTFTFDILLSFQQPGLQVSIFLLSIKT